MLCISHLPSVLPLLSANIESEAREMLYGNLKLQQINSTGGLAE